MQTAKCLDYAWPGHPLQDLMLATSPVVRDVGSSKDLCRLESVHSLTLTL